MDIIFSELNHTGIITLNRPKALNALNLDMAKKLYDKLKEWEIKDDIKRVLLIGVSIKVMVLGYYFLNS